jgi:hypothetical protein
MVGTIDGCSLVDDGEGDMAMNSNSILIKNFKRMQ